MKLEFLKIILCLYHFDSDDKQESSDPDNLERIVRA